MAVSPTQPVLLVFQVLSMPVCYVILYTIECLLFLVCVCVCVCVCVYIYIVYAGAC